jgi:hypothetical protein
VLNLEACEKAAVFFADALNKKRCGNILAGHYGLSCRWMPCWMPSVNLDTPTTDEEVNKLREKALKYLTSIVSSDFEGSIQLESSVEIRQFLSALLTYPIIFSYMDLYLFCTNIPLVMGINHHASALFYSTSKKYLPLQARHPTAE